MRSLIRCLRRLIAIRQRDGALVRSGGQFVDLFRIVYFRPLPEIRSSCCLSKCSRPCSLTKFRALEPSIGREGHDHEHDKNRYDDGWNKPGFHCACLSLSCKASRHCARHGLARRFASASCTAVTERLSVRILIERGGGRCRASLLSQQKPGTRVHVVSDHRHKVRRGAVEPAAGPARRPPATI